MRQIYSCASRVLVWLGPGTVETSSAFDFLDCLASVQCRLKRLPPPSQCTAKDLHDIPQEPIDIQEYQKIFAATDLSHQLSVKDLFHRAWFRRVWVIQEVTRGSPVTIFCGEREMDWNIFTLGTNILSSCVNNERLWHAGQLDIDTRIGIIHACSTLANRPG